MMKARAPRAKILMVFNVRNSEAWNMIIAGYQPLEKWLKDRKDKHLTGNEIIHYQKMVVALVKTIRTQEEILSYVYF